MSKVWLVATQTVDFGGLGDHSSDGCDEADNGVLNGKDPGFLKQVISRASLSGIKIRLT